MSSRRSFITLASTIAVVLPVLPSFGQAQRRIPLLQLEAMFADMRSKTKWDVDGPLLWGYFFLDPSSEKLKAVAADLETSGFRVVGIEKVVAKQAWRLHVERVEAHTPVSLNARNNELYLLAEKYSLVSYDGMDVGPAPAGAK
jgi:hypothetical protein